MWKGWWIRTSEAVTQQGLPQGTNWCKKRSIANFCRKACAYFLWINTYSQSYDTQAWTSNSFEYISALCMWMLISCIVIMVLVDVYVSLRNKVVNGRLLSLPCLVGIICNLSINNQPASGLCEICLHRSRISSPQSLLLFTVSKTPHLLHYSITNNRHHDSQQNTNT